MDGSTLFIVGFWIFWAVLCGVIAHNKGRNVPGWVVLGLLFGIFSFIVLLFMKNLTPEVRPAAFNGGTSPLATKSCQNCFSDIPAQATVCRVCSRDT